jgi:hypothetical protein
VYVCVCACVCVCVRVCLCLDERWARFICMCLMTQLRANSVCVWVYVWVCVCMCLSLDECVPGYRPASNSLQRTHALPNKKILEESAPHAYLQQPQLIPSSHPLTSAPSHSIPSTSTHPLIRFMVERSYGTRYQSGSFSLIYVESASHCPRK